MTQWKLLTLLFLISAGAGEIFPQQIESQWNGFRGSGGSGIAADNSALPEQLDPAKNLLWKTAISSGHSSPCIWGERIFLTGFADSTLETICLDRQSGKILWRRKAPATAIEKVHPVHNPAAATPATDGNHVFVYFGSYGLIAYDFTGAEVWKRPLPQPKIRFGSAASPIIASDYLIFKNDNNEKSYLEAIEPASGKTVWRIEREGFEGSWSSPLLWQRGDVHELIIYGIWWVTAYDLKDGRKLWAVPGLSDEPTITPVTGGGLLYLTSYNMKTNSDVSGLPPFAELLKQYDRNGDSRLNLEEASENKSILSRHDADGEGDHPLRIFMRFLDADKNQQIDSLEYRKLIKWVDGFAHEDALVAIRPANDDQPAEIVWQYHESIPEIPSPLYYDGRIYLIKNGGIVAAINAEDGKAFYRERLGAGGPYYASPVAGDGKIYTASARGVVTIFAAGDSLKILSRNDLGERIMATPALLEGTIYLRTAGHMWGFGAMNNE